MNQEIYVKEMPEYPSDCPCNYDTFCNLLDDGENCWFEIRKDCPLKFLHDHDKELVARVCEKIKEQLGFIVDGQERISCDGSATGDKTILAVLDQIQKEFEDGK